MDIEFQSKKDAKVVNQSKELLKKYGKDISRAIILRLSVLFAAPTLNDVPVQNPDRRHQLSGDKDELFSVDLKHPYRLIFKPNHCPIPRKPDGGIDLTKVTSVLIVNLMEDTHK